MADAHFRVFRGGPGEPGHYDEFDVPAEEGMVVLDALHWIQGTRRPTSPSAGIARPPSAAPAAPRSTAARA